jgi:hypothetical protein
MTQPSPKPTVTPSNPDVSGLSFTDLGNNSKKGSDAVWDSARKATFDLTGLGIPGHTTGMVTGDQLLQIVQSAAQQNKSGFWGGLRAQLSKIHPYTKRDQGFNWTNTDTAAVEQWLTTVHNNNVSNPTTPMTPASFLKVAVPGAVKSGVVYNITNNILTPPAPIRAPATADLDAVAQKAFRDTLGRPPTAQESPLFSKQFQDLALSIGNSKNASRRQSSFAPVADPASLSPVGQSPAPVAGKVAKTADTLQDLPNASVAATNFARNTAPAEAGAENIDNALNGMFASLSRNSR